MTEEGSADTTATCRYLCDGMLRASAEKECSARVGEAGCADGQNKHRLERCVDGCKAAGRTSPNDCTERCGDIYSTPCGDDFMETCTATAPKWGRKLCYSTCSHNIEGACVLAVDTAMLAAGTPDTMVCHDLCGDDAVEYHGMIRVMERLLVGHDVPFSIENLSELVADNCLSACEGTAGKNNSFQRDVADFCALMVGRSALRIPELSSPTHSTPPPPPSLPPPTRPPPMQDFFDVYTTEADVDLSDPYPDSASGSVKSSGQGQVASAW